ncbi:hypothetical protein [Aeoliella mucimassa]|uniref:Uncharacterized protein n=1 Tax=Aeoliella mucimassa TaxID=2527972 RepID=A0A518AWA1_9BACT|nr:hypothetical protein [Aeoliella mucimassa]QDU59004.1 hypothetical protein Pan181_52450 [Aeoliella mucimassa]
MKATLRGSATRPRDLLREVERRAVAIRKLLNTLGQGQGREMRGVVDDAVKLAESIEHIAHWGQSCPAADVVEVEFRVEVLISLLEVEVDHIFAS